MQPFTLEWQAPEFEHREKTIAWYWGTILIAVAVLAIAVWQRNFLFAVFTMIAEVLILFWSGRKPSLVQFRLTERGLTIDERSFYPLSDMQNFSVQAEEHLSWPIVAFQFHRRFRPLLHVHVHHEDLHQIKHHLNQTVPEAPWEESLIDTLEKFFGF